MMSWLTMNVCISLIALAAVALLRRAPARISFYLLVGALVSWCLPLSPWIVESSSVSMKSLDVIPISAIAPQVGTAPLVAAPSTPGLSLMWLLIGAGAFGLAAFAARVMKSQRQLRELRAKATPLDPSHWDFLDTQRIPVSWLIEGNNAFTTGLLRPTIWIGQTCLDSTAAKPILTHEWVHAARRDNLWLLLIELVRHGLWWNPLVWVLAHRAKLKLEMSCDEACEQQFDTGVYLKEVAAFFTGNNPRNDLLSTSVGGTKSTLVKRVQHLVSRKPFGRTHGLVLIATTLATAAVLVQAEVNFGPSSVSMLQIEDSGRYRLTLDNAHPGDAIQRLASLGGLHVLAHPDTNSWRVSTVIEGAREQWTQSVRDVLNANRIGRSYDYVVESGKLLLAPKAVLASGDDGWLTNALQMTALAPPPPDTEASRIAIDVAIQHGEASFKQNGLVLSEKAWFALSQASIGLNIRPTVLEDDQVMLQMRIDDTESGKVLSTPTLITAAGKTAMIKVGDFLTVEVSPTTL